VSLEPLLDGVFGPIPCDTGHPTRAVASSAPMRCLAGAVWAHQMGACFVEVSLRVIEMRVVQDGLAIVADGAGGAEELLAARKSYQFVDAISELRNQLIQLSELSKVGKRVYGWPKYQMSFGVGQIIGRLLGLRALVSSTLLCA